MENVQNEGFRCDNVVTDYKCVYCDFTTDLQIILKEHFWFSHKSLQKCRKTDFKIKCYRCKHCIFRSYSLLVESRHTCDKKHLLHWPKKVSIKPEGAQKHDTFDYIPLEDWEGFSYSQCSFTTKYHENLKKHIIEFHTAPEWFECDLCTYRTNTKSRLKEHTEIVHNIMIYYCKLCEFKTRYSTNLQRHNFVRHVRKQNGVNYRKCNYCSFTTIHTNSLNQHESTQHRKPEKIKWFHCHICKYKTAYKKYLYDHIILRHTDPEKIEWLDCNQCSFKAKIKRDLYAHTRKHCHGRKILYKCGQCFYKTPFKRNLKIHIDLKHTDFEKVQWFECDQCDFKAKTEDSLKQHISSVHCLQGKSKCNLCSFTAYDGKDLEGHIIAQHIDPVKIKAKLKDNLKKCIKLKHGNT